MDGVLLHLWREYGALERPVPEDGMQAIFERVAGVPLGDLFDAWIRSPAELDLDRTFAHVGLTVERSTRPDAVPSLGVRLRTEGRRSMVAAVLRGGAGAYAGIDAGDELAGVAGFRVESSAVDAALAGGKQAGDVIEVVVAREGRLLTARRLTLMPPDPTA